MKFFTSLVNNLSKNRCVIERRNCFGLMADTAAWGYNSVRPWAGNLTLPCCYWFRYLCGGATRLRVARMKCLEQHLECNESSMGSRRSRVKI